MNTLIPIVAVILAVFCLSNAKPLDASEYGVELIEGDMLLTKEQKEIYLSRQNGRTRRAALKDRYLWPRGVIPFTFSGGLDNKGKNLARRAMQDWTSKTCLKFKARTNERAYIEFQYDGKCRARVGYTGTPQQKVSVGSRNKPCSLGSSIHELGHAIGFFHEHSRPDRDQFITVNWGNVRKGVEENFRKDDGYFVDSRGANYDYGSIMHYSRYQGNNKANAVVLQPKEDGAEIGQRNGLSDGDIDQTKTMYKCNAQGDSELEPTDDDDQDDDGGEKKMPNPEGPKPGEIEE